MSDPALVNPKRTEIDIQLSGLPDAPDRPRASLDFAAPSPTPRPGQALRNDRRMAALPPRKAALAAPGGGRSRHWQPVLLDTTLGRMEPTLPTISLSSLIFVLIPSFLLIGIMHRWSMRASSAVYANARMLIQLLGVGYLLTYIFETNRPLIIVAVVAVMILAAASIALRPLKTRGLRQYAAIGFAVAASGLTMLALVTQVVLDLPRWFEPRFVVPLAGMIFANLMNTVSLAAERFESEIERNPDAPEARRVALEAAMIPQINSLLAVGLVSLPGMMTGQILSGVDPQVAVRYQVMVMGMVFGSGGLAAAIYLGLRTSLSSLATGPGSYNHQAS